MKMDNEDLNAMLLGYQQQIEKAHVKIAEIQKQLNGSHVTERPARKTYRPKKRKLSEAGRLAISNALKKRWAAAKKEGKNLISKKKATPAKRRSSVAQA